MKRIEINDKTKADFSIIVAPGAINLQSSQALTGQKSKKKNQKPQHTHKIESDQCRSVIFSCARIRSSQIWHEQMLRWPSSIHGNRRPKGRLAMNAN